MNHATDTGCLEPDQTDGNSQSAPDGGWTCDGTDSLLLQIMYENYTLRKELRRSARQLRTLYLGTMALIACMAGLTVWSIWG